MMEADGLTILMRLESSLQVQGEPQTPAIIMPLPPRNIGLLRWVTWSRWGNLWIKTAPAVGSIPCSRYVVENFLTGLITLGDTGRGCFNDCSSLQSTGQVWQSAMVSLRGAALRQYLRRTKGGL